MDTYMSDVQARSSQPAPQGSCPLSPCPPCSPEGPFPAHTYTYAYTRADHKEHAAAIKSSVGSVGGFTTLMTLLRLKAQQVTQQVTEGSTVTLEESVQDALDGQRQLTPLTCMEIRHSDIWKHTHVDHVDPSSHCSNSSIHSSILSLIHGPMSDLSVPEDPQSDESAIDSTIEYRGD
jgi:hypothetical protein